MKTLHFHVTILMVFLLGMGSALGQWSYNGSNIYNNNSGYVGIGYNAPSVLLHAGKNMAEPTIAIQNFGGIGGATFQMLDNVSGANWKFKATNAGGFKIRDNGNALDVIMIEPNSAANAIYIDALGHLGLRTSTVFGNFYVPHTSGEYTAQFGTPIAAYSGGSNVSIGSSLNDAVIYVGQTSSYKGYLIWEYNSTPANGYFEIGTYNGSNPLVLQPVGGNVGIGTTAPASLFDCRVSPNAYSQFGLSNDTINYIYHNENPADGDGQSAVFAYRTRTSRNDGTSYAHTGSNFGLKGYSFWGDNYSFGVAGYNWLDYERCGGIIGSRQDGGVWGSLGYRNSGFTYYGGYFTSTTTGTGAARKADPLIGIGIGAWGDLMGADIHGKLYGIFAEGSTYAMFSNGAVYKNDIDVHLQNNGQGGVTALYTNVSTDVCIQTCGVATLNGGRADISFAPEFAAAVSSREPVVVTVTPVGPSSGVYLSSVSSNGFTVMENTESNGSVTVNYIAIGRRAGFESPALAPEIMDGTYVSKLSAGLHEDADLQTNGSGLYYENGQLVVGVHPSTLPDPGKREESRPLPPEATRPYKADDPAGNGGPGTR